MTILNVQERVLNDQCTVKKLAIDDGRTIMFCSCEESEDFLMVDDDTFLCADCEIDTHPDTGIAEYYNVINEIWWEFVPEFHGMLCLGCLELRMGRQLTREDFSDAPINYGYMRMSDRFKDRMGLT